MNSVFMKKIPTDVKLDYASIMETIPKGSYLFPQNIDNKIEIRWRFITIPNNKQHVEISRRKPGCKREYINKKWEWIETDVDSIFDQFVKKEYYYYADQ